MAGQAGEYNQALMDLGATICSPRRPGCQTCPLVEDCLAHSLQVQEERPVMVKKPAIPHYTVTAAVIGWNGNVLITQRPLDGLLGGLWEFPGGKVEPGETLAECLEREICEELGAEIQVQDKIGVFQHAYTHFRITLHAFHCQYVSGEPQCTACTAWRWVNPQELELYAFPAANRKIISVLQAQPSIPKEPFEQQDPSTDLYHQR